MEPVKEKLKHLQDYLPNQQKIVYDFAVYLADKLNQKLVPRGFNVTAALTLYDLEKGVNGFTGQPIQSRLVGCPSVIYRLLEMQVPEIAEAVCPEEFAQGVRKMYDEVNAKIK